MEELSDAWLLTAPTIVTARVQPPPVPVAAPLAPPVAAPRGGAYAFGYGGFGYGYQ